MQDDGLYPASPDCGSDTFGATALCATQARNLFAVFSSKKELTTYLSAMHSVADFRRGEANVQIGSMLWKNSTGGSSLACLEA